MHYIQLQQYLNGNILSNGIEFGLSFIPNSNYEIFGYVRYVHSGSVAEAIATRLLNLSKTQQILIVTHLPQVAARGQQHFKTSKSSKNNITVTGVKELSYEDISKILEVPIGTVKSRINRGREKLYQLLKKKEII